MTSLNTPVCCTPQAIQALAAQFPLIDSPDALVAGALALCMHILPKVDAVAVDTRLQGYADSVRARVHGHQRQATLAHLHELLFEEEGFAGNTDDYYNIANNFLPHVLETKRGLPITLALVYKSVANRLGLNAYGVNLPGHFLVGVECDGRRLLVDAFNKGRLVSEEEAFQRVRRVFGDEVELSDNLLRPASHKLWLTRMLQNMLNTFGSKGQYADVAAMLELEMVLWPGEARLQRDLALVLARCGMSIPARMWLGQYLRDHPDDPQHRDLQQLMNVLAA